MNKLQENVLQILEKREADPGTFGGFLEYLSEKPSVCLKEEGLSLPHNQEIGFTKNPKEHIDDLVRISKETKSSDSTELKNAMEDLAKSFELFPAVTAKNFQMPEGARLLNEAQLKRIVG